MGRGRRTPPVETVAVAPSPASLPPPLTVRSPYSTSEPQTSYLDATTYNNFYEFGTGKGDPARNAHTLRPRPWTLTIEGEVNRPQVVDIDRLLGWFPAEE